MNNTEQKTYKKKRPIQKPKTIINTYEKKFESFNEMIDELRSLHSEISDNIFQYEINNTKDAMNDILRYYSDNIPDITEKVNLHSSLTISANKVVLKTNKFFTIGWKFKYNKDGEISELVATVSTFTRENVENNVELQGMIDTIETPENGWSLLER